MNQRFPKTLIAILATLSVSICWAGNDHGGQSSGGTGGGGTCKLLEQGTQLAWYVTYLQHNRELGKGDLMSHCGLTYRQADCIVKGIGKPPFAGISSEEIRILMQNCYFSDALNLN